MSLGVTRLVMLVIPSASAAAMITTLELATVDNSRRPARDGYHNRKLHHPAGVEIGERQDPFGYAASPEFNRLSIRLSVRRAPKAGVRARCYGQGVWSPVPRGR
jgi:hypothetical protein